jgi:predicted GH43/DUF377 family glycosyl hydrolase
VPFYYNRTILLFIQRLNPMRVVRAVEASDNGLIGEIFSEYSLQEVHWEYGWLRGSSNAVLLEEYNCYLSFFHSRASAVVEHADSYFFGALTFSPHPPFHILSISPYPIVGDFFYVDVVPRLPGFEYIVYPSSFYVESGYVILSVGVQDQVGVVCKVGLRDLLEGLTPVA